ncbi:MAG TPA: HNH endonuclease, partial [Actinomycetota bacterium]|nr:HNH endonuclease [Actinomycetota bacterium]
MLETVDITASIGLSAAEDALVNAAGQIAAAQCRWLVALGNLDPDGEIQDFYSVASWLSWRCSIHIRTATEYAKVAHALKQLPGITD